MLKFLFWLLLLIVFYTYFGYPLLLVILTKFQAKSINKADILPKVSLIIAAYNEEKAIACKIENTLALDYPEDKLEIIVASDSSTDSTHEIVRTFINQGVKLYISPTRSGKTAYRNEVIKEATGDIVIFSDATGMYNKDVIKKLIRNFNDARVGCVGGLLKYINSKNSMVGSGEGLYWRYEVSIREKESALGNLMSVSGTIYAMRKNLYVSVPKALADDLISPLMTKKQGYYCIYETEAICVEETVTKNKEELAKRARIALRNIMGLYYMKMLFNPFKYGMFSLELFSHKILRLLIPLFLILLILTNSILLSEGLLYLISGFLQGLFYVFAIMGYIMQKMRKENKIFYVPLYFCITNLGILLGIIRFFSGKNDMTWEPVR